MKGLGKRGVLVLWAALGAAAMAGCGAEEDSTGMFVGEWLFTSGTENTQCPTLSINDTDQLSGVKLRIGKGVDSPLVYSETQRSCVWKMTPNGSVATISSGQSCGPFTEEGAMVTAMYTAGTFTVTGTTATYSGTRTAMVNIQNMVVNCTSTGSGGLMKVAQ